MATHGIALLVAVGLASYSSVSRGLPSGLLRLGVANSQAQSMAQGGQVATVSLGRDGVVLKPTVMPNSVRISHDPVNYTVGADEDLRSIARKFSLTVDELRWSNPRLGTTARVRPGDVLLIPPIAGVVVQVRKGDTVASLAAAWHVDPVSVEDFNFLRDPVADLKQGRLLVLPAGRGSLLTPTPADASLPAAVNSRGTFAIKVGGRAGTVPFNRFPFGQCTWYVASKVSIPWNGDAWTWYGSAQAAGWTVGSTPRVGAIMVTWESRIFGHVSYVEAVNADGSWIVSEMNYVGWGVIDQRMVKPGSVPLIGFVYAPN
ncbi:MAG TPA: CHAP domain-containing protein [Candidatus Dormibacteraeota bacterium]